MGEHEVAVVQDGIGEDAVVAKHRLVEPFLVGARLNHGAAAQVAHEIHRGLPGERVIAAEQDRERVVGQLDGRQSHMLGRGDGDGAFHCAGEHSLPEDVVVSIDDLDSQIVVFLEAA